MLSDIDMIAQAVHYGNRERGFYEGDLGADTPTAKLAKLMLVNTELAEAAEAIRQPTNSTKIPGFTAEEEEIADAFIRLLDYSGWRKLRLVAAIMAKLEVNATRGHRHGGKKA